MQMLIGSMCLRFSDRIHITGRAIQSEWYVYRFITSPKPPHKHYYNYQVGKINPYQQLDDCYRFTQSLKNNCLPQKLIT